MTDSSAVYATGRWGPLSRLASRLSARARRRRYGIFVSAVALRADDRIVDVGCGRVGLRALDAEHEIVGVDHGSSFEYAGPASHFVRADALAMPFADGEFDVAYCNSLIEHVHPADRPRLAAEVRRVARRYFVQTPNRWFPIEPHVLLPLFQFLPRGLQRRLWRFGVSRDPYQEISLLTRGELARLFPEAEILRERVGPLTKSWMAAGPRSQP
jgi:SAM-dependent methyltransferase